MRVRFRGFPRCGIISSSGSEERGDFCDYRWGQELKNSRLRRKEKKKNFWALKWWKGEGGQLPIFFQSMRKKSPRDFCHSLLYFSRSPCLTTLYSDQDGEKFFWREKVFIGIRSFGIPFSFLFIILRFLMMFAAPIGSENFMQEWVQTGLQIGRGLEYL